MRDIQIDESHSFEITYQDAGLDVGMTVFDDSGVAPVQVGAVIAMTAFKGRSYRAKFTPTEEKSYLLHKAVYTDGTFTTVDDDYSEASDAFRAMDLTAGGGSTLRLGTAAPQGKVVNPTVVQGHLLGD